MDLILTTIRCPVSVSPEIRRVTSGSFTIGRGPDNDWVLADPDKHLSKKHCVITLRHGVWQIAGMSTNGTFVNRDNRPLEASQPRVLENGDRLRLGAYEIEARMVERRGTGRPAAQQPASPFGENEAAIAASHAPAAPPQTADPKTGPEPDLLAAFLRGARAETVTVQDPARLMEELGAAFRAIVTGLRQAVMAKADVKRGFRIESTAILPRGNNMLKFSANDDDALAGLLGARRTEMRAEEAIADVLEDIRLHELATMAAMQSAVRALVARLGPDAVREASEPGSIAIPVARKSRAWDAYSSLHASISNGLADDFDSAFGKGFARAYEQATEELSEKEKRPRARRP